MNTPNILIFMTDQQQGVTILPEHPCRTPNLEKLAADGVTFTNVMCPAPHCCPTRATFMSGLYPSRHGVFNNVNTFSALSAGLRPDVTLFSEQLRDAGYRMAYSGKWHVSREESPGDRGWENLNSGPPKGAMERARDSEVWKQARAELSADEPTPCHLPRGEKARAQGQIFRPGWGHRLVYGSVPAKGPNGYEGTGDYHTVERALKVLPELAAGEKPWCLFVGVNGPHDAFVIPEPFAKMYDADEVELPPNFHDTLEDKPRIYQRMRHQYWGQLTEREVRESIAHYWGYCTMEDALFGLVLDALGKTGAEENTLVIYISDHGDYCGAHGLYCKGVPAFREAYHVPTIIRWPRGIANPGRRVDAFVSHADFAPTFLELAGCEPTMELAGQSLSPWLHNENPTNWRDAIFTQLNGVELYYTQRTVTTERYKYVYNGFDFDELYDLMNDPHEMVNLAFPDRVPQIPLHNEERLTSSQYIPWPKLSPKLESVRQDLLRRMWRFAREQEDYIFNAYFTVAMAPWGPAIIMDD